MRYGRPIARVVSIERTRKIRPLAGYGTKIAVKGDLFSDDSALWEDVAIILIVPSPFSVLDIQLLLFCAPSRPLAFQDCRKHIQALLGESLEIIF